MYTQQTKQHHSDNNSLHEAEYRSEYRQNKIIARIGTSYNHNRIVSNLLANLCSMLADSPYELLMGDVRLSIPKKSLYAYPDLIITCGDPQFVDDCDDTITNPKVIFEVWSKSTVAYQNSNKFEDYWSLPSFEEYVLIDQHHRQVRYFRRMSTGQWDLRIITNLYDCLKLKTANIEIPLEAIYRNTH